MGDNNETDQLTKLVERIQRYQTQTRMSDKAFCGKYRQYIGSPKTWRDRLLGKSFKDLAIGKWLGRLNELCGILDGGSVVENFFKDLPFVKKLEARLSLLEGQTNDRRCLVVLATTGVGKSVAARGFVEADRKSRSYIRMLPTWRENYSMISQGVAEVLECAVGNIGGGGSTRNIEALIMNLRSTPRTVFFDEAHDGGVALMKIIKTLIDSTPSRFVYLAYPTDFDRVRNATKGGLAEAQQFLGRCLKPTFDRNREGLLVEDVVAYLRAAAGFNGDANAIAQQILPTLRRHYNFRLLDDAIAEARFRADEEGVELDGALVIGAVEELIGQKIATPEKEKDPK